MDTQSVWGVLANIPVGTIVSWIAVIFAIIAAFCTVAIKLYKVFEKYHSLKDENLEQKHILTEHDDAIEDIKVSLEQIRDSLSEQKDVNLKQIRHTIVHDCDEAIALDFITAGKLRSLEELYQEYIDIFHGNGYVKTLIQKVRKLPVVAKLDE